MPTGLLLLTLAMVGVPFAAEPEKVLQVWDQIVYSSSKDGNAEIYIMNLDGSGQTRLTFNQAYDADPCFSPDGRKIAFVSDRDGNKEIYIMNVAGGEQNRLTFNDCAIDFPTISDGRAKITMKSFDGSPCFSPDGKKIAFISNRNGNREIYTMNIDGSGQKQLTSNEAEEESFCFSPDGMKIVYDLFKIGDDLGPSSFTINIMNIDGSEQTCLTTKGIDKDPHFSPDGKKIATVSTRDGNHGIFIMNSDGSEQTRLFTDKAFTYTPLFSPDGKKIVFLSHRDYPPKIYIMNSDGSEQTRLTSSNGNDENPLFSPNGKKIAFESKRDGNWEIYIMNINGSEQTLLGVGSSPSFAPMLVNGKLLDYYGHWHEIGE